MNVLKRILKGVILKPESTTPSDASNGALWYDSTLGKLRGYISGSARSVVNEDQSQTLTNKTIDADLNTINNIENGDIKAAAAIEMTKLAAMASDKAVFTDVSGFLNTATTTATELDYLSGVTSGVQAQLNAKASSSDLSTHMSDTTTHGTTGDIVGTSDTQNLSNKTFTNVTNFTDTTESTTKDTGALVIEGGVGIEKSVTVGVNLEVLGNLTVQGTTTTLNTATLDVEDANITINSGGNDAGAEGSGLTIDRTGTSGSFVYEDALASKFKLGAAGSEAQVVTVSHTQTLTNKTLTSPSLTTPSLDVMTLDGQASTPSSPSSGFYKAYVKDSTNKLTLLDSSGNETSIGAGGGAVNFVTNPDAEAGTTGYTIDSFAAASRPAGALTGTTTGITFSTSSSSPLAGVNSFTLAKDAANRQGRVVYTPITITPAYQAKVLNVSMDYIVSSGTFVAGSSGVDSDVIVYLQDVTNSTFIEPSSFKLLSNSTTIADKFQGTFQTSATGTSYRLLLYFPTTTTSAFTLKLDNISVSPSNYVYGTPITDWSTDWTPTGAWTTNTTYTGKWRQVGSNMEMVVKVTCSGAPTATTLFTYLPGSYVIDTDITPVATMVGQTYIEDYGLQGYTGTVFVNTSTQLSPGSYAASGSFTTPNGITQASPITFGASDYVILTASVPILGWSSSVQTSDSTDTRVVAWSGYSSSTQSITSSFVQVTGFGTINDTHGAFSSNSYTAPVSGYYQVNGSLYFAIQATSSQFITAVYKNGSLYSYGPRTQSSSTQAVSAPYNDIIKLNAGDVLTFYGYAATTTALNSGGASGDQHWSIQRLSGPSAIAATETVSFSANTSTTAATTSAPFIYTATDHNTHGAYSTSTGKFTAPVSGKYCFQAVVYCGATVVSAIFYKNGSTVVGRCSPTTASTYIGTGTLTISLVAGDTIEMRPDVSATAVTGSTLNTFSGFRIGI